MVWALHVPKSFGMYWPDGRLEQEMKANGPHDGWFDRLAEHHWNATPEEKVRLFGAPEDLREGAWYPTFVSRKLKSEQGSLSEEDGVPFGPVLAHEPPKSYHVNLMESGVAKLGSLIALPAGLLAVDEKLRGVIEAVEPGVHEFYPLEIIVADGSVSSRLFYTLVIGQFFESFSAENSDAGSFNGTGPYYFQQEKSAVEGLCVQRSRFKTAHLWAERNFSRRFVCLSDHLRGQIRAAGLSIPKCYRLKEVD